MDFKDIGLRQEIVDALATANIATPTTVQEQAIPMLLQGKDLVMQSQTGSGKTLAYLLPIYQRQTLPVTKGAQAVIIVPTRELAMQVHHEIQTLSASTKIPLVSAVLFGNVNINKQVDKLKEKPQIIIGTSDRILNLIKKKKIPAHTVKTFIVDEADKLLDKQSIEGLKAVRKTFMRDTEAVFVSATFSTQSLEQVKLIAPNCEIVKTQSQHLIPPNISHYYILSEKRDKLEMLRKMIAIMKPEKSVIFINQLDEIYIAVEKMKYHDLDCECIHSDTLKQERQKRLLDFSTGKLNLLIATDLASRGIHIDGVTCVYSVSTAEDPTDYLHRAGRTGRTDKKGMCISTVTANELATLEKYKNKFKINIQEIKMRNNEIITINPDKSETVLFYNRK